MHPILFHLGRQPVPTFAVLAVFGLMVALALSERTAKPAGLLPERLLDAAQFAAIAAFVITRILLIAANWKAFLAAPMFLLVFPSLTPLGMLLTTVATILWLRSKDLSVLSVFDAWAPCATLLWCFLALGHFAEGSDPGLPTALPWGLPMNGHKVALHPVAVYAAIIAAGLTLYLLRRLQRHSSAAPQGLILTGLGQFFLSFAREPGFPAPLDLDSLQWVALSMIVVGGLLIPNTIRRTGADS